MRKQAHTKFILSILVVVFMLTGCSFIRIQNVSSNTATVSVRTPDSGKAYTRTVRSGAIVDVFSSYGGRYTITTIPSEQYRQTLFTLQQQISTRLFEEGATLTADQVRILTENLNHIDQLIEGLDAPGVSCTGSVADFDTSVAIIAFDLETNSWVLNCGSTN